MEIALCLAHQVQAQVRNQVTQVSRAVLIVHRHHQKVSTLSHHNKRAVMNNAFLLDCTLLLVVDDLHLCELCKSMPTWLVFCHELRTMPITIVYDAKSINENDDRLIWLHQTYQKLGGIQKFEMIPWPDEKAYTFPSHREKMLRAYLEAPRYIDTAWFLKIDTDAICLRHNDRLYEEEWFEDNVIVSFKVKFKRGLLERFETWAKEISELSVYEPVDIYDETNRIISWVMFGNVEWCKEVASMLPPNLPFPSQDITHAYMAKRMNKSIKHVDFSGRGWKHELQGRKIVKSIKRDRINPTLKMCKNILKKEGIYLDFSTIYPRGRSG